MKIVIISILTFLPSIVAFVISIRSFQEKGFLFNNAYLFSSKQERETMNKKPYYRQSAVTFLSLGIAFLSLGLEILLNSMWFYILTAGAVIFAVVYAIASSISLEKWNSSR